MPKTADDVLTVWEQRGYCDALVSEGDKAKYQSFIDQARQSILTYCRLPEAMTALPDGLLYPWAEIGYAIMTGGVFEQANGTVKSIREGDTETVYNTDVNHATAPTVDYSAILNRYRNLY